MAEEREAKQDAREAPSSKRKEPSRPRLPHDCDDDEKVATAACEVLQWRMTEAGRSVRLREINRMLRIGLRDPRCTYFGVDVSWYSLPRYETTAGSCSNVLNPSAHWGGTHTQNIMKAAIYTFVVYWEGRAALF